MLSSSRLLTDLQGLIRKLETDLRERTVSKEVPEVGAMLQDEYRVASQAKRTAASYQEWLEERITQMAIAWVLSGVFGRFLEDNGLVEPPKMAGVGKGLQRARDEHELYFRAYPQETDRDYLLAVFRDWATLPVAGEIFGGENPLQGFPQWLSGDGAAEILKFFQRIDSETGALVHDFTDPSWDTRFLGDLYQDLSEGVRKKYALLQTPIFVEEFILDRTLEPALNEFGLQSLSLLPLGEGPGVRETFRLIDPACGSGHFLLGAFQRILRRWQSQEPGANARVLAQRALDSVFGVDVNPYAVSIARFRLLLAALLACDITRLKDAPGFQINVACGDSLLHGAGSLLELTAHYSRLENASRLQEFLRPGSFHAVVANPPYITPKDKALNQVYRDRYSTCHMKYSLAIPFMERIYELAVPGGYTGQITANSFMKKEFGKRLIEDFFKRVDLQTVIDTSGAYIPGHGTPTVILFGRNRKPVSSTVRAVMGIRGEPTTPENPATGLVWTAILNQVDIAGSESEFVSVADLDRQIFQKHPWSLGGGGATDLKEWIDQQKNIILKNISTSIGYASFPGLDDAFVADNATLKRNMIFDYFNKKYVDGEVVRDWGIMINKNALVPYDEYFALAPFKGKAGWGHWLWKQRTSLGNIKSFGGKTRNELNLNWWGWYRWIPEKYKNSFSIVFGNVATHNHFVFDCGGKVYNGHAPVIKLAPDKTEDDHLALLGLLNSSTACFWMKQVYSAKGGDKVGSKGARVRKTWWDERFEFDGTKLQQFPIPSAYPLELAQKLDRLAQQLTQFSPQNQINNLPAFTAVKEYQNLLKQAQQDWQKILETLIFLQEELDWHCYFLYGLIKTDLTYHTDPFPLKLGQRPFEILLAQQIAQGESESTWFERHNSQPITEIPKHWPQDYQILVQKRLDTINSNKNISLIEKPEYKRRWNTEPWETQLQNALQAWLLDRLESYFDFDGRMNAENKPTAKLDINLISTAKLADIAQQDPQFMAVAELYTGDPTFKIQALINKLVENESVPLLPVLRYKPSGLRKRQAWENTWHLQRLEDQIDARGQLPKDHPQYLDLRQIKDEKERQIGTIPVPPKYTSSDFLKTHHWRLRGKLDVPKERWVSFPHCQKADGQPLIAWAGYNPLQLAQAISAYYVEIQEKDGGQQDPRLIPLLAGLLELLPWLKQWHNAIDPEFGLAMGDYFEQFIQEEAKQHTLTLDQIRQWQPPKTSKRRS